MLLGTGLGCDEQLALDVATINANSGIGDGTVRIPDILGRVSLAVFLESSAGTGFPATGATT